MIFLKKTDYVARVFEAKKQCRGPIMEQLLGIAGIRVAGMKAKKAQAPVMMTSSSFKNSARLYKDRVEYKDVVIKLDEDIDANHDLNNKTYSEGDNPSLLNMARGGLVGGVKGQIIASEHTPLKIKTDTIARVVIKSGNGYIDAPCKDEKTARDFISALHNTAVNYKKNKNSIDIEIQQADSKVHETKQEYKQLVKNVIDKSAAGNTFNSAEQEYRSLLENSTDE